MIRQVKALDYRLEAQSPLVHLQPYFGQTVDFALEHSIAVRPGDVIALTVPTWVPALELEAGRKAAWRASRSQSRCTNVAVNTAQTGPAPSLSTSASIEPRSSATARSRSRRRSAQDAGGGGLGALERCGEGTRPPRARHRAE